MNKIFLSNIYNFLLMNLIGKKNYVNYKNQKAIRILKKSCEQKAELLKKNQIYKNKHQGQRCFVLGNGPSLNNHNLSVLENEIVFTVNQISRHKDFQKIKTNYHFWADPQFFDIDINKAEDVELLNKMKSVNTADNKPVCFYEMGAYDMIKTTGLEKELNIQMYKFGRDFCECTDCEIDMTSLMPGFHTVVQLAIATAIYMGFSEIYFLGCESTSIISSVNIRLNENLTDDYAYELSENEDKRMRKRVDKVSFEQELYSFYKVISDYKLLNDYCKKRGIKLCNCTPGGLVEGVPRVNFESLFEESCNE